jgi:hypothetical protein
VLSAPIGCRTPCSSERASSGQVLPPTTLSDRAGSLRPTPFQGEHPWPPQRRGTSRMRGTSARPRRPGGLARALRTFDPEHSACRTSGRTGPRLKSASHSRGMSRAAWSGSLATIVSPKALRHNHARLQQPLDYPVRPRPVAASARSSCARTSHGRTPKGRNSAPTRLPWDSYPFERGRVLDLVPALFLGRDALRDGGQVHRPELFVVSSTRPRSTPTRRRSDAR